MKIKKSDLKLVVERVILESTEENVKKEFAKLQRFLRKSGVSNDLYRTGGSDIGQYDSKYRELITTAYNAAMGAQDYKRLASSNPRRLQTQLKARRRAFKGPYAELSKYDTLRQNLEAYLSYFNSALERYKEAQETDSDQTDPKPGEAQASKKPPKKQLKRRKRTRRAKTMKDMVRRWKRKHPNHKAFREGDKNWNKLWPAFVGEANANSYGFFVRWYKKFYKTGDTGGKKVYQSFEGWERGKHLHFKQLYGIVEELVDGGKKHADFA